jgi:Lrp/AsnC family leucine-responsive transcriptional regulator
MELDSADRQILALMQQDARLPFTEIGRRVHLTSPAVAERAQAGGGRRDPGLHAASEPARPGYSFEAFVQVVVQSDPALLAWAAAHPEVLAVHATTGEHCALLRLALTSPEHLQSLLGSLASIGKTHTSVVLSSSFEDRARLPGDEVLSTTTESTVPARKRRRTRT